MRGTIESAVKISENDVTVIKDKLKSLSKFDSRATHVHVFFKKRAGKVPHGILAEIRVNVPGSDIFAEATDTVTIKAFIEAFNAVKRQLKKRKEKVKDHRSDVKEIREIVNDNL